MRITNKIINKFSLIYVITFSVIYSIRFLLDNLFLGSQLTNFFVIELYDLFVLTMITNVISYLVYDKIYKKN
jgi:hypothetical protein